MTVLDVVLDPVSQVLSDLATCLCAQIITDGLPNVCSCGVMPGEQVALDQMGDCNDTCGQAWVRLASSYPSTSVGLASELPGNCSAAIGLDIELGIARCVEIGDANQPPSLADLTDAAYLQSRDMLAMWRAVACCRQSKDWAIGQYQPFGPQGGVVGGILPIAVLVF